MIKSWLCRNCGALLGYVENGTVCRMKRKDFYVAIFEAKKILTPCYKCGTEQSIEYVPEAR